MKQVHSLRGFFGRNVSYSKEKHDVYTSLIDNEDLSPFNGGTMVDVFVYAAVWGFVAGKRSKLKKATPNISVVAMTPEQKALLLTIAISDTGTIDVLFDDDLAATIVEEYANAGIGLLESEVVGNIHADVITNMALKMKEIAKVWNSPKA